LKQQCKNTDSDQTSLPELPLEIVKEETTTPEVVPIDPDRLSELLDDLFSEYNQRLSDQWKRSRHKNGAN